ncbi:MAG: T9SS type A sorting domain-containing protein, partial [Flavobacteriales bacterium]|nr:T9SS type A sorting domain-containing protein [Flavobacteriales bacterium]
TSQTYSPAVRLILSERVGVDEIANLNGIHLNQNIPNPASNVTTFNFELSQSRSVQFEIRDLSGRVITRLEKGTLGAGAHTVTYDVRALSSGLYTYTLIADGVSITKKMVIR